MLEIFFLDMAVNSTAGLSSSPAMTVSPRNRAYVFPTSLLAVRFVRLENPTLTLKTIPFLTCWVHLELSVREPSRNSMPVMNLGSQSSILTHSSKPVYCGLPISRIIRPAIVTVHCALYIIITTNSTHKWKLLHLNETLANTHILIYILIHRNTCTPTYTCYFWDTQ